MGLICGICHEDKLVDIGEIDSCEHRFCYTCICKWSEIESKCPFCKVRFSVLKRIHLSSPLKCDSTPKGRLVGTLVSETTVPERDQRVVFEDPTFLEWLNGLSCIICDGSEDEDRLLLCDGCDQACHTYCLGLDSVPEEAWFCSHCQAQRNPVVEEHQMLQLENLSQNGVVLDQLRSRSRSRSLTVIDSDDEDDSIADADVLEPRSGGSRGSLRNFRSIRSGRRANSDRERMRSNRQNILANLSRLSRDRQRVESLNRNWTSLQNGNISFEEILDTDDDEVDPIEAEGGKHASKEVQSVASPVDLTSPQSDRNTPPNKTASNGRKTSGLSPPLLDLRSRLRVELLNHEKQAAGFGNAQPDTNTPPSTGRHRGSSWRNGRATTIAHLSFGASVANGRPHTPRSHGVDGAGPSSGTFKLASPTSKPSQLFAHKAQEMVHAMTESNSKYSKKFPVNTRHSSPRPLAKQKSNTDVFDVFRYRDDSPSQGEPVNLGNLVKNEMALKFRSISLPREMERFILRHALAKLASCSEPERWVEDAIDEGLNAYDSQSN